MDIALSLSFSEPSQLHATFRQATGQAPRANIAASLHRRRHDSSLADIGQALPIAGVNLQVATASLLVKLIASVDSYLNGNKQIFALPQARVRRLTRQAGSIASRPPSLIFPHLVLAYLAGQQQMTMQQHEMQRIRSVPSLCSTAMEHRHRHCCVPANVTARLAPISTGKTTEESPMRIIDATALSGLARKMAESASGFASVACTT